MSEDDFESYESIARGIGFEFGGITLNEEIFKKSLSSSRYVKGDRISLPNLTQIGVLTPDSKFIDWKISDAINSLKEWLK